MQFRAQDRAKAVSTTDMSFVSRQLEKESRSTVRGTISGQIPRILLIQVSDPRAVTGDLMFSSTMINRSILRNTVLHAKSLQCNLMLGKFSTNNVD